MKQWKRAVRQKCQQIVNACNECQVRFNAELDTICEDCMSRSRCQLAREILEELN